MKTVLKLLALPVLFMYAVLVAVLECGRRSR